MKHYVLGLVYNIALDHIVLIKKKKPKWMNNYWNGVGGKINDNETPMEAIHRETAEELKCRFLYNHVTTFVCPGGTVFVYKAISTNIIPFHNILKYSGNKND
ncbi:hypothetical protein LCGC14_2779130, partial [marine sediment metagenome]